MRHGACLLSGWNFAGRGYRRPYGPLVTPYEDVKDGVRSKKFADGKFYSSAYDL